MKFFGFVLFVLVGLHQGCELRAGYEFNLPFVGDSSFDEVKEPRDKDGGNIILEGVPFYKLMKRRLEENVRSGG